MSSWVEKYRPKTLNDIIGQEKTIKILQGFIEEGCEELPHFLFAGPTGVGKTATVQAFAKDVWGDEWRNHYIDYNASDERGIDVVREKIKQTARISNLSGFRIIFLDEIDSMTDPAQKALRRIMEDYSENTKFFLSCNYPSQLLDAVKGRCVYRSFKTVDIDKLTDHLEWICNEEEIEYDEDAIHLLAEKADGKVRNAIQNLQALSKVGKINEDWVQDQTTTVSRQEIARIYQWIKGDEKKGRDIKVKKINEEVAKLQQNGADAREVVVEFFDYIIEKHPHMGMTLIKLADCDVNISQGANEWLQLRAMLIWLIGKVDTSNKEKTN